MKLVKESLEPLQFQRGLDPKEAMGIGKRPMIKAWLDEMGVKDYTINENLDINTNKGVDLRFRGLYEFPDYIQFGKVDGYFACSCNNLTSLRGAPLYVKESFFCSNNRLTTLEGAPKFVGGDFYCYDNAKQFTEEEVRSVCDVKGNNIKIKDIYNIN